MITVQCQGQDFWYCLGPVVMGTHEGYPEAFLASCGNDVDRHIVQGLKFSVWKAYKLTNHKSIDLPQPSNT